MEEKLLELNRLAIMRTIKQLDLVDLDNISIDELCDFLTPLFTGLLTQAPRYKPGVNIYRGRICSKPNGYPELIYPPAGSVSRYGRVTDIGETMFYGATTRAAPFFELRPNAGDHIAISKWRSTKPMVLNHVGFTEEATVLLNSNRELSQIYEFVKESKNFSDINSYVHNYLASKFIQVIPDTDSFRYKLTIAIAIKMLGGDVIHGLLFPTIAMSANVDNIVLKPSYFDDSMKFVSVEYLQVEETSPTNYSATTLDTATKISKDGIIEWSGRNFKWVIEGGAKLTFKAIGNEWAAFDEKENRIDPE